MPLPHSRVIPDGWSQHHRPTAEHVMTAACAVRRPGHATGFDENTGRSVYPDPAPFHAGPCRIQVLARLAGGVDVGDAQITIRPYQVSLPADVPEIRVNDQVEVTSCPDDPLLVGRLLRVVDVPAGSLLWQRDLTCEDITPTTR